MSMAIPEAHDARPARSTDAPQTDRITVYSHEAAIRQPGRMLKDMWSDLRASNGLAWQLAMRDIRAQYRQSYLGYLWAFIMPLANTVVWIVLNSTGVVRVADTSIPYPAYVFTGTMIWQLLTEAVQSPLQQVSMSRNFLTKLNFPRESLVLSGVFKQLFGLAIKLAILVPVVMLLGVVPDLHLLLVPFALLAVVLTGISVGLVISPIGLLYTDVARGIPLVAQFAMYTTPVIFAMPSGGSWPGSST
ncbi:MAG: ABC transporter permease [Flavobacteriales bacterium]